MSHKDGNREDGARDEGEGGISDLPTPSDTRTEPPPERQSSSTTVPPQRRIKWPFQPPPLPKKKVVRTAAQNPSSVPQQPSATNMAQTVASNTLLQIRPVDSLSPPLEFAPPPPVTSQTKVKKIPHHVVSSTVVQTSKTTFIMRRVSAGEDGPTAPKKARPASSAPVITTPSSNYQATSHASRPVNSPSPPTEFAPPPPAAGTSRAPEVPRQVQQPSSSRRTGRSPPPDFNTPASYFKMSHPTKSYASSSITVPISTNESTTASLTVRNSTPQTGSGGSGPNSEHQAESSSTTDSPTLRDRSPSLEVIYCERGERTSPTEDCCHRHRQGMSGGYNPNQRYEYSSDSDDEERRIAGQESFDEYRRSLMLSAPSHDRPMIDRGPSGESEGFHRSKFISYRGMSPGLPSGSQNQGNSRSGSIDVEDVEIIQVLPRPSTQNNNRVPNHVVQNHDIAQQQVTSSHRASQNQAGTSRAQPQSIPRRPQASTSRDEGRPQHEDDDDVEVLAQYPLKITTREQFVEEVRKIYNNLGERIKMARENPRIGPSNPTVLRLLESLKGKELPTEVQEMIAGLYGPNRQHFENVLLNVYAQRREERGEDYFADDE